MKSLLNGFVQFSSVDLSIFRSGACIRNSTEFVSSAPYPGTQQHCSLAPLLILFAVTRDDSLPVFSGKSGRAFVRVAWSIDSIKSCPTDCRRPNQSSFCVAIKLKINSIPKGPRIRDLAQFVTREKQREKRRACILTYRGG